MAALGIIYLTVTVESPAVSKLMQRMTGIFAPKGESAGAAATMTPPTEAVRDTWFQHAAFYTAFGYWPDVAKPLFDGQQCQVPDGEHNKLLDALQKMHQSAADGELTVWGKIPGSSGRPRQNSVFQKIPAAHWLDHAVAYLELLCKDPDLVRTTKDHEHAPDFLVRPAGQQGSSGKTVASRRSERGPAQDFWSEAAHPLMNTGWTSTEGTTP